MVFNTLTVSAAVTPSVIETYLSHYLNRGPLRHKPTAHISYHEGLRLIREFLDYSSKHTIEDLQAFTAQWVPAPTWVRINDAEIAPKFIERAARLLQSQLGQRGLNLIGGKTWWQWRRPENPLRAEWIEMKKDQHHRNLTGNKCERVMLYVHGGAYYFGSVDEHRYQMQRHARKLKAQLLAPRYRVAPQFPFPCGLLDCLSSYFYLLEHFEPSQILFAGDSAGGGMVLSMLVTLRDQGEPLPAGTILLSPWVDLTHSFPSVAGDGHGDYIPPHGFHHKPSMAWPPPPSDEAGQAETEPSNESMPDDIAELPATAGSDTVEDVKGNDNAGTLGQDKAEEEFSALPAVNNAKPAHPTPRFGGSLSIMLDGQKLHLREQIQMYTTNALLAHPLVSPVMQPSLGGLPPMLIQTGGAELLRDEQVYLAHKAANPTAYPPNETIMREFDPHQKAINSWPPTDVQLQLWDDLCHVPHTLSFTRPAKYMYRSVAQFAAWALAHAQEQAIEIQNDDAISFISSGEDEIDNDKSSTADTVKSDHKVKPQEATAAAVGRAGDPLPPFKDHMIRQRVTRHGIIFPLTPSSDMAALALDPESIGVPKAGPVRKWLATHASSEQRFANERKKVERRRAKEVSRGYDTISGEHPPPTALVNRRRKGVVPEEKKKGRSWGLAMWSGWGSSHDEQTLEREQRSEKEAMRKASAASAIDLTKSLSVPGGSRRRANSVSTMGSRLQLRRSASRKKAMGSSPKPDAKALKTQEVTDTGQATEKTDKPESSAIEDLFHDPPAGEIVNSPSTVITEPPEDRKDSRNSHEAPQVLVPTTSVTSPSSEKIAGTENTYISPTGTRPHNGVLAYPFKLRDTLANNASNVTLDSQAPSPMPGSGLSTPHSELAGDAPAAVELPSAIGSDTGEVVEHLENAELPTAGSDNKPAEAETARIPPEEPVPVAPPDAVEGNDAFKSVSPAEEINGPESDSGPTETISQQKAPFKIRNQVFDNRTSMLGSIGADGMPNAHYAFLRDDPLRRKASSEEQSPVSLKPDEGLKAAPFKLRHTVYGPDVTLGTSQILNHSSVPEHVPMGDESKTSSSSRLQQESDAFGTAIKDQRVLGQQRDLSPSYNTPATNGITPTPLSGRSVAKPAGDENDKPPPPPPKDDFYVPSTKKATGFKRPKESGSFGSGQITDLSTLAGMPGTSSPNASDMSFEKSEFPRPPLESFVTASEGKELSQP